MWRFAGLSSLCFCLNSRILGPRSHQGRTAFGVTAPAGRRRFGQRLSVAREPLERRAIAHVPGVAEGVAEAALAVNAPRDLVVADPLGGAVRAGFDRPLKERLGVVDEDLDADGRLAGCGRADESCAGRLVEEEGCAVDLEADNGAEAPELGRTEGSSVPAGGLRRVLDGQHQGDMHSHTLAPSSSWVAPLAFAFASAPTRKRTTGTSSSSAASEESFSVDRKCVTSACSCVIAKSRTPTMCASLSPLRRPSRCSAAR